MPMPKGVDIKRNESHGKISIAGSLSLNHFRQAEHALAEAIAADNHQTVLDLSHLTHLDTAGAFLLRNALLADKRAEHPVRLGHIRPEHKALLDMVMHIKIDPPPIQKTCSPLTQMVTHLGKATIGMRHTSIELISFMGQACVVLAGIVMHPSRMRLRSVTHHIEAAGIDAIPIIALIACIISIVLAYQGQAQLGRLGAEQYTVNLIAISVLREMGVLLTAIMVAGRSGSAFAAEISTMKVRKEVDALRTIGLKPFELLVLPRLLALIVVLPLLTLLADITGLAGGAWMSFLLIHISLPEYLERVRQAASWKDFLTGMIKAPVFGFVIALVGCQCGLKASGSSESVGKQTTAAVVKAIFLVLVLDGLFSIYFQKVGL